MFEDNTCQNCNYPGSGKCSECDGTGKEPNIIEAFAEALVGESQDCKKCGGSRNCPSCGGKGWI